VINLLEETKEDIKDSGHKAEDIIFIGSEETGHSCTWKQFEKLADFKYNNGYGSAQIATDLIIVFSDGTKMWRHEYDEAEWWSYSKPFVMPKKLLPITKLGGDDIMWESLAEINGGGENDI
jgi:hypothetical protein